VNHELHQRIRLGVRKVWTRKVKHVLARVAADPDRDVYTWARTIEYDVW
jgi:hypothetical protein